MDIIVFPFHDYKKWLNEGFRTRDAHLFEHFLKSERVDKVLVVNRPVSLAEICLKRTDWRTEKGNKEFSGRNFHVSKFSDKAYCIDFFSRDFIKVLQQRKNWWHTAFSSREVLEAINDTIEYLGMKDRVLLLQNPMAIGVVERINAKLMVFDAIDNWLHHPQMQQSREIVKRNYEIIGQRADIILTVSEELKKLFPDSKNVNWISNGVDKDYFRKAFSRTKNTNAVIGYVGKIQERVDFELLEKCLVRYPHNKFVIIGPAYAQKEKIQKLKRKYGNINFKGDVHYNNLPEEMQKLDIAIIPHKVDEFTNSMNPLKLYEYLAAGKPTVTTKVAGTDNISPFVHVAETDEEFIAKLGYAIDEHDKNWVISEQISSSLPDLFLWSEKVQKILDLFESGLKLKGNT